MESTSPRCGLCLCGPACAASATTKSLFQHLSFLKRCDCVARAGLQEGHGQAGHELFRRRGCVLLPFLCPVASSALAPKSLCPAVCACLAHSPIEIGASSNPMLKSIMYAGYKDAAEHFAQESNTGSQAPSPCVCLCVCVYVCMCVCVYVRMCVSVYICASLSLSLSLSLCVCVCVCVTPFPNWCCKTKIFVDSPSVGPCLSPSCFNPQPSASDKGSHFLNSQTLNSTRRHRLGLEFDRRQDGDTFSNREGRRGLCDGARQ